MAQYPIRQSLQRTTVAAGVLALVLATAPVVPTLDADGDLALSSATAHAQGRGGGRGRGHNDHTDFGEDHEHSHAVGRGHFSHGAGLGLGHVDATGYGHHHDEGYVGGLHDHDGDGTDLHSSDPSFSTATDNARRDFGRLKSRVKGAWSDLWN